MTALEKEMLKAISDKRYSSIMADTAKAAAEIAAKYIEKAIDSFVGVQKTPIDELDLFIKKNEWLKENGVI